MDAKSIFGHAQDIESPEERAAFLAKACGDNTALRQEVNELLTRVEDLSGFMQKPAIAERNTDYFEPIRERPGTIIGPYKLLQQIGEGGMGVVFMAEQSRPVQRKVALKIIKPGMDSRQVIARFEAERQALALMDHPNIARVLDAGTTESGRPYFVMELVRGVPITTFCDKNHLSPSERLKLFVPVCHAVQHAHQKGIIHRDLKPSNVPVTLYDGVPVPKVIDFGVAKATGGKLTERTLFTEFGSIIGTLEYMSPEQAEFNQLDVDTRSDVYSLGVLLYELLTGSTPLDHRRVKEEALLEILRLIREVEPPKPSTRVSTTSEAPMIAANRGVEPKKLSGMMRGELDWIVMKALDKDRNQRYETANSLAKDVERYLSDEPVQACPPNAMYRFRKFARRNKRAVFTAGALAAMLLVAVGVIAASIGWVAHDRAARQTILDGRIEGALQEVQTACDEGRLPEAQSALKQAESLLASGDENSALGQRIDQWRVDLAMINRLDAVRFGQSDERVESWDDAPADSIYQQAFATYGLDISQMSSEQWEQRIQKSKIQNQLIASLDDWTFIKWKNDLNGIDQLLDISRRSDPDPWRNRLRDAVAGNDLATLLKLSGDEALAKQPQATVNLLAEALIKKGEWKEGIAVLSNAQQQRPSDFWANQQLARHLLNSNDADDLLLGLSFLRASVALRPDSPGAHVNLGVALTRFANNSESEAEFRRALELAKTGSFDRHLAILNLVNVLRLDESKWEEAETLIAGVIKDVPNHWRTHLQLGNLLFEQKKYEGAELAFRTAIQLAPKKGEPLHQHGLALFEQKRFEEAKDAFVKRLELDPESIDSMVKLIETHEQLKNWGAAVDLLEKFVAKLPDDPWGHWKLGYMLLFEAGTKNWERALQVARREVELGPKNSSSLYRLGCAEYRSGNWEAAVAAIEKSVALDPVVGGEGWQWYILALANEQLGRHTEARRWLDKAIIWHWSKARQDRTLNAFHAEAAELFGISAPFSELESELHLALEEERWDDAEEYAAELLTWWPVEHSWASHRRELCRSIARHSEVFDRMVETRPLDVDLWVGRAWYHAGRREWKFATEMYEKAPVQRITGDDRMELAAAHLLAGDVEQYEKEVGNIHQWMELNRNPWTEFLFARAGTFAPISVVTPRELIDCGIRGVMDDPVPWREQALSLAYYRAGDYRHAIELAKKSNARNWFEAAKAMNSFLLAMAHHRLGEIEAAREHLLKAVAQYRLVPPPEGYNVHELPITDLVCVETMCRECEVYLREQVETAKDEGLSCLLLAEILAATNRPDEAEAMYVRAIKDQPREFWARWSFAKFLDEKGKRKEADQLVLEALSDLSNVPSSELKAVAEWCAARGKWRLAADALSEHLKREPKDFYPAYQLTFLLARLDKSEHRAHCQKYLPLVKDTKIPNEAEQVAKACLVLESSLEEMRLPIELGHRSVALGKGNEFEEYFDFADGLAFYRDGEYLSACHSFERCLESDSDDMNLRAMTLLVQAMAYHKSGNSAKAREVMEHAQKIRTTLPQVEKGERLQVPNWHDGIAVMLFAEEADALFAETASVARGP